MMNLRAAALAGAISLAIFPALAMAGQPDDRNPNSPGLGWGPGGKPSVGAPGPIAGAGLPFLAGAAIGYLVLRRRKRNSLSRPD